MTTVARILWDWTPMLLPRKEAELVFKLHCALMQFVIEQLKLVEGDASTLLVYATLPAGKQQQVERAFLGHVDLVEAFIAANPAGLSQTELEVVSTWRHLVFGRFIALRQLKKHLILLPCDGTSAAYGVTGLVDPIERVIGQPLPAMIEIVLLPFRGRITYAGIVSRFNVTFGPGSRRGFEQAFRAVKANNRFVTSLPVLPAAPTGKPPGKSPMPKINRTARRPVPTAREILTQVVAMTDAFCETHLTREYAELCRKLAENLAAKRPSPLLSGRLETWACGIIRTIGWVNFLDDRSQSPHMSLPMIDRAFGVAESTGQGKAKAIRQWLKVRQFDHRWTLPSRWESNPIIWTLQDPNGFMIDIRKQPVAMQRAAFRQGLIPYVPADRAAAAVQEGISTSSSRRLFQFKVTLRGTEPAIWRRIQVLDDTMDKLHEHLQTAMGWTNSHLHHFFIQGQRCGDPELLDDDFEPYSGIDSTQTLMSAMLPAEGPGLVLEYHYDFGDGWVHDVLFEGSPPSQPSVEYPQCLEGERACPPEDVGGIEGYSDYIEALADPNHEEHQQMLDWRGPFDPNSFNPRLATHQMQEGMPEWRRMV
ncbi:MAG: plasmid pRiA4b ORF-3 family protein [Verrucomicrobia bacterium]|nr:plasmid pRiA4b ORF-3 family protein [Verrucomicrobiota bacterium]